MAGTLLSRSGKRTSLKLDTEIAVCIVVVHPGEVSYGWHESVLRTLQEAKYHYSFISAHSGVNIAGPRNVTVERFLSETNNDYFLSTDSDIEWEPEMVEKLVKDDLPIVSGLYMGHHDSGELFPVFNALDPDRRGHRAMLDDIEGKSGTIEVFGVGMGFTLVKREVLEALGTRTFWPFEETVLDGKETSEDITFCRRAASKGYKAYVDLDVRVGHRKAVVL